MGKKVCRQIPPHSIRRGKLHFVSVILSSICNDCFSNHLLYNRALTCLSHSMIVSRRSLLRNATRQVASSRTFTSGPASKYGRAAIYRRSLLSTTQRTSLLDSQTSLPSYLTPSITLSSNPATRLLHTYGALYQQEAPKPDVKDPPRPEGQEKPAEEGDKEKKEDTKTEGEGEEGKKDEKKKDAPPPPPPHGDKTPWQVFTETLRTEFKASQEWNESTKQLGGKVQDFRESERVKKARAAYEATAGPAANAVKATGRAIGTSAAWTWDTSVVQGVRKGVNATGRGIEKATRPVRETKTFKEVSKALDDGSSSRYGGWVEKEERRKRREEREMSENPSGRRAEKIEEDPKYVIPQSIPRQILTSLQQRWYEYHRSQRFCIQRVLEQFQG